MYAMTFTVYTMHKISQINVLYHSIFTFNTAVWEPAYDKPWDLLGGLKLGGLS